MTSPCFAFLCGFAFLYAGQINICAYEWQFTETEFGTQDENPFIPAWVLCTDFAWQSLNHGVLFRWGLID
jgi:hypothetical protein